MESSIEAGKVKIIEATYGLLKEDADSPLEYLGEIAVKGKGQTTMYFVAKNGIINKMACHTNQTRNRICTLA
jgi:hypothetical protein